MKRLFAILLAVAMVCGVSAAPANAKTWNLRFAGAYMDTHPTVINGLLPWFEEIKTATQGQVKIRYFNVGTICPENEIYSSAIKGVVDMGGSNHARVAGKFPLHDIFSLPLIASSSEGVAETAWTMLKETPALQKEMEETKVLGYWASVPFQLHTVSKPVEKLEDLKGMRIIAWSKPGADMLSAWGANPIIVAPPESYLALSRAQADGVLCPLAPFRSFKLNEATRYTTIGNFAGESFYMVINKKRWEEFPPEIRAAIESLTDDAWTNRAARTLDDGAAVDVKILTENGHTFFRLAPEELSRWADAIAPLDEAWVEKVVKLGVISEADARAMLARTREVGKAVTARLAAQ